MYYSPELVVLSLPILLLFIYVIFINQTKSKSKEKEAPELRSDWPIIGHLHLLGGGDKLLYRILGSMAAKYGPAFNIRLGAHRSLVVSSWEVAKECFTVNDLALASRPKTAAVKHMCYNYAMFGMGPYTPYWREMRKIVTLELLSNRRLEMLKHIRSTEITCGINELYGRWKENSHQPVVVELNKWLEHIMLNIIMMMVAGKRYFGVASGGDEAAKCHEAIIDFFRLCGLFVVSDAIPSLGWLDLQGYEKQMKKTGKDFDLVLGGWLEEHRQKRKLCLERNKLVDAKDFIDVMLSLEDEKQLHNIEHDSDTIIKSTCLSMILGGSDTTAVTLTWAISLLLNHPDVLKKLQQELDDHETLRLYSAGPLLAPREAREDCTIAGYNVKAGARLIINVWKLQRDETVWRDPSKFQPEWFIGVGHEHIDVRGHQFVLVPFGLGRRSCPGISFALQVLHLTLARLVHSFDLGQPGGLPVDMSEGPGMTLPKKKPLEVLLTPRLPSSIYGC
ncbi:putative cytochrome P450 [Helianthus annuus]|uniref:Cytochrome P450 n=1 Tax=Helianthus annuus TaxID=4232 RepID=A0A9K3JM89_HELAN|nr:putative cytochrome P450 [Helianthus annuus]KAJ0618266.1 putative cytochrome P450 [Helianthus annuus]KAJ0776728.1 putative cytochrome P450 [Helianthus annuus]KAJ0951189.1 putative cytochrome P450 [Helianthus annuus]